VMPQPNMGIILSWRSAPCGGCGRRKGESDKGPTENRRGGGKEIGRD
jgi:hypothetical protein